MSLKGVQSCGCTDISNHQSYSRNSCSEKLTKFVFQMKLHTLASEVGVWRCSIKKVFLKISQNSQEITCARVATLLKKTLVQLFPSKFFEIFKNTFFHRTPPVAASVVLVSTLNMIQLNLITDYNFVFQSFFRVLTC